MLLKDVYKCTPTEIGLTITNVKIISSNIYLILLDSLQWQYIK